MYMVWLVWYYVVCLCDVGKLFVEVVVIVKFVVGEVVMDNVWDVM